MSATSKSAAFVAVITLLLAAWLRLVAPSLLAGPGSPAVHFLGLALDQQGVSFAPWGVGLWIGGVVGLAVLRARAAVSVRALGALLLTAPAFIVGAKLQFRLETLPLADALRLSRDSVLDPGMRLPLGLLLGGLAACGAAWVLRVSWRAVGDAFALGASAMIPVGRIACLLGGCCIGTVAGPAFAWLGVSYPPGSEAYAAQLAAGLIQPGTPLSLPAHPLPAYFALASLATLVVLVRLLRRGAPPGMLLAVFCVLRPAAKLALEPLRALPRPGPLMFAIPAVVLLGGLLAVALHLRAGGVTVPRVASRPAGRPA